MEGKDCGLNALSPEPERDGQSGHVQPPPRVRVVREIRSRNYGPLVDSDGTKIIRMQPAITQEQSQILERHFLTTSKPSLWEKRQITLETQLSWRSVTVCVLPDKLENTLTDIQNWFQNRRLKTKQQRKQQEFEDTQKYEGSVDQQVKTPSIKMLDCPYQSCQRVGMRGFCHLHDLQNHVKHIHQTSLTPESAVLLPARAINSPGTSRGVFWEPRIAQTPDHVFSRDSGIDGESKHLIDTQSEHSIALSFLLSQLVGLVASQSCFGTSKESLTCPDGLSPEFRNPLPEPSVNQMNAASVTKNQNEDALAEEQESVKAVDRLHSNLAISGSDESVVDFSIETDTDNSDSTGEFSFIAGNNGMEISTLVSQSCQKVRAKTIVWEDLVSSLVYNFLQDQCHRREQAAGTSRTNSEDSQQMSNESGFLGSSLESLPTSNARNSIRSTKRYHKGNDEDDEKTPPKRPRRSMIGCQPAKRLLACPYAKNDRVRYSEQNETERFYRKCKSSFLKDISRLKQHLYRVHRRPEHHCPSCFLEFQNQNDLDIHARQRPPCDLAICPFDEKMTSDQVAAIKRREMGKDPEKAWFDVYEILFPGAELPPTPYADEKYDIDEMERFYDFFQNQAPTRIAASAVPLIFGPDNAREFEEMMEQILEDCISSIIQRYRQDNPEDGGQQLPEGVVTLGEEESLFL